MIHRAVAAAGAALIVGGVAVLGAQAWSDGSDLARTRVEQEAAPSLATGSSAPGAPAPGSLLPTRAAGIADLPPAAVNDPVGLRFDAIAAGTAPVVPVGTDPVTRQLVVPRSTTEVAWWAYGARPGDSTGTVVLAAHVDFGGERGVFFSLASVPLGAEVVVDTDDGATSTYRVTGRTKVLKSELPGLDLFRRDGAPRLVLITCGGEFDEAAHSYTDNIVVTAEPV